jgi:hypothetical protein
MKISAKHQLILTITNALNHPVRLQLLDLLQTKPMTVAELNTACHVDTNEHLSVLKTTGLLLGEIKEDSHVSLSPFGIYGAGKIMNEILMVTHEDGQCGGCKGCSEKK